MTISYADFLKVEMRVGEILEVHEYPEARAPSYRLLIDFGAEVGQRQSVAALKQDYSPEVLVGRQVVAVTNFPSKQIGKHKSEVLVLAAVQADDSLRLLRPDDGSGLGCLIR